MSEGSRVARDKFQAGRARRCARGETAVGGAVAASPSFGYFSWRSKKSNPPSGGINAAQQSPRTSDQHLRTSNPTLCIFRKKSANVFPASAANVFCCTSKSDIRSSRKLRKSLRISHHAASVQRSPQK